MMMENCGITPVYNIDGNGNNDNGWGDGGWIWVIFLFFIMAWSGGWGNGFGGNGGAGVQGALTRGDLCMDMNFNDVQNGVRNISDAVNTGFANLNSTICHQQYDTAMLVNGVTAAVNGGFAGLNSTICQQQYDTANMLNQMNISNLQTANAQNVTAMQNANALQTQLAECCCELKAGQLATQNQIQAQTCELENTMNNNTRAILDYLCQDKISTLQTENQALRLSASQERQNAYLIDQLRPSPVPAFPVPNPFGYYGYNGFGQSGCGCGGCC